MSGEIRWFFIDISDEYELLFWSNEDGWVGDVANATMFSDPRDAGQYPIGDYPRLVWTQEM